MYKFFIRPILFLFDPERIHHALFNILSIIGKWAHPVLRRLFVYTDSQLEKDLFGLRFKNPIGLAAGFDKNGKWIDTLACFGFSFIEIGTITPRPQAGNPTPRLFRLPEDQALINRMGFNNIGAQIVADHLAKRLQHLQSHSNDILIGGNIGKNRDTPNKEAKGDYEACFQALYPYVDYFVINVSSPNTPGLVALQSKEPLRELLIHMKKLSAAKDHPKPILLKIGPDLSTSQLEDVIHVIKETQIDGVVATNTTVCRNSLITPKNRVKAVGNGGLSGHPLTKKATKTIQYLRQRLGVKFPIIGVGGIMSPQDAINKMKAGADLVQLYTGFVYEGPALIRRSNKAILQNIPQQHKPKR